MDKEFISQMATYLIYLFLIVYFSRPKIWKKIVKETIKEFKD